MHKSLLPVLCALGLANAESPLGFTNELASRTPSAEFAPDGEWTLGVTYVQGLWEYGLENVLYLPALEEPSDAQEGEATLGVTATLHEFFALGASATLTYLDAGQTASVALTASPSYRLGNLEIADDNEFSYDFDAEISAYTNTLALALPLHQHGTFALQAAAENEAARALENGAEWEDALDAGLAASVGPWSVGLFYSPVLLPDVEHGLKITLGHAL
jgi:hypothetical protein